MRRILLVALCILRLLGAVVCGLPLQIEDTFSPPLTVYRPSTKADEKTFGLVYEQCAQHRADRIAHRLQNIITSAV